MIKRNKTFAAVSGIAVALVIPAVAHATVLIDTMGMVDAQTYEGGWYNSISGQGAYGTIYDDQLVEDFAVPGPGYAIDHVTGGFVAELGHSTPSDGAWVQFYADIGGAPSETVAFDYLATGSELTVTPYTDTMFGIYGVKIAADLTGSGIVLPAGTWWVDIQPVDTTPSGDMYYQVFGDFLDGHRPQSRAGSQAHGNNYATYPGAVTDWEVVYNSKTFAFRVDGTAIPEPASALLLAFAALPQLRRKRRAARDQ